MLRVIALLVATLVTASIPAPSIAQSSCMGSGLAIASSTVSGVAPQGALNRYHLTVTVVNRGAPQAKDTLQFVDIYQGTDKLDAKGVPPLGSGQSYTIAYDSLRSRDAGNGTTNLRFALDVRQPQVSANCLAVNDITF